MLDQASGLWSNEPQAPYGVRAYELMLSGFVCNTLIWKQPSCTCTRISSRVQVDTNDALNLYKSHPRNSPSAPAGEERKRDQRHQATASEPTRGTSPPPLPNPIPNSVPTTPARRHRMATIALVRGALRRHAVPATLALSSGLYLASRQPPMRMDALPARSSSSSPPPAPPRIVEETAGWLDPEIIRQLSGGSLAGESGGFT